MSNELYIIAEGDGEVAAAPHLVRRLLYEHFQRFEFNVPPARNANGRTNLIKPRGLEAFLERLRRTPDCKGVIILLDTEQEYRDCPPRLALDLAQRSKVLGTPFPVVVVCAACEYESWFLFNLHTQIRHRLNSNISSEGIDPEKKCGAKEWLSNNMPSGSVYKETTDQVAMTTYIDIPHTIDHSRSFRRMVHAVEELLTAIDTGQNIVSPLPQEGNSHSHD